MASRPRARYSLLATRYLLVSAFSFFYLLTHSLTHSFLLYLFPLTHSLLDLLQRTITTRYGVAIDGMRSLEYAFGALVPSAAAMARQGGDGAGAGAGAGAAAACAAETARAARGLLGQALLALRRWHFPFERRDLPAAVLRGLQRPRLSVRPCSQSLVLSSFLRGD